MVIHSVLNLHQPYTYLYFWYHGKQAGFRCGQNTCWCLQSEWCEVDTIYATRKHLLTQHWAGQQLLFSMRCQTFQSVVAALVHHLPSPVKDNVEMSAVRASTYHYIIYNTCQLLLNGAFPHEVHLLWSHFPRLTLSDFHNSSETPRNNTLIDRRWAKLGPQMKPVDCIWTGSLPMLKIEHASSGNESWHCKLASWPVLPNLAVDPVDGGWWAAVRSILNWSAGWKVCIERVVNLYQRHDCVVSSCLLFY